MGTQLSITQFSQHLKLLVSKRKEEQAKEVCLAYILTPRFVFIFKLAVYRKKIDAESKDINSGNVIMQNPLFSRTYYAAGL